MRRRTVVATAVVVSAALAGWAGATPAGAQLPLPDPSPTTTAPPSSPPSRPHPDPTTPPTSAPGGGGPSPSTTAPPSGGGGGGSGGSGGSPAPTAPSDPAPSGNGGNWWVPPSGGIPVPSWAQQIISAHPRTPPNDNSDLLAALAPLQDLGMTAQEAAIVGSGRFPIAGPAHFMDDFLFPRWGPAFRFHQGCDVMADYGLPVRSPADGVARVSNSTLGGLSVYVTEPDGTFYYLAHLSGLADGIANGVPVTTGQVVGFVGDSGNARGGPPHVHFEIHPQGGDAVDPKPILDQWLLEAEARVPELLASFGRSTPGALVGTGLVAELFDDDPSEAVATVAAGAAAPAASAAPGAPDPMAGQDLDDVDWAALARMAEWQQARAGATAFLGPLLPPVLASALVDDR